jgi:tetratricopeptide (TPR) repeat protein
VNYRPEYQHAWGSKMSYSQMRLDALPAASARQLLDALLGDDPGLAPLKQLLVKRGNPFFLEETVRTLVETKALAGERGRYRLAQPVQAIQVPATVQTMLAGRIDRLPPEDKRLLQVASVIGKDVPFALLQAIADLPDEALRRRLDHLQAAEFLYETGLFPDLEYTFKHALTHEVAYGSLLHERRRDLHARIIDAMERLHADRLQEHAERLGDHAFRGEAWEKAVVYLGQAGAKAMAAAAYREAVVQYRRALDAHAHVPETRASLEQGVDLRFHLHDALLPLSEYKPLFQTVKQAEAIAVSLGDQWRLGRASSYLSHHAWISQGNDGLAVDYAQRALAIARATGNRALEIVANFYVGQIHSGPGDYRLAVEAFFRNIAALPIAHLRGRFETFYGVTSRAWAGVPYSELGEFADGLTLAEEALGVAEASKHPIDLAAACMGLGQLHVARGDFARAASILERGLAAPSVRDLPQWFPALAFPLGRSYVLMGRIEQGVQLLEDALRMMEVSAMRGGYFNARRGLAEGYLMAGRIEEATAQADTALSTSRSKKGRGFEAWTRWVLGEIASRSATLDLDAATVHYRQALAIATELGMRPLVAHCHLGLGKLYRRTGDRQQAQEHLTTATTMYREMDMRFWLEQAEGETSPLA